MRTIFKLLGPFFVDANVAIG